MVPVASVECIVNTTGREDPGVSSNKNDSLKCMLNADVFAIRFRQSHPLLRLMSNLSGLLSSPRLVLPCVLKVQLERNA